MDVRIMSLKCIGWQKVFAHTIGTLLPNDKLVIKASRQKGKSTMLSQSILYFALNYAGSEGHYVSPTYKQSLKQFNAVKKGIAKSNILRKCNETTGEIEFLNGSKIYFLSAEAGDNLRGFTTKKSALFIDEAAFVKDDIISGVLLPYVTVNKCPIIISSTPRKKRGVFYNWWVKAVQGEAGYKYIDVNEYDNSFFITPEQIEDYRKILSPEKFKNEILGLFSDDSEGVFGDYQRVFKKPEDNDAVYAGIDWSAKGEDSTVAVFFNKNYEMCDIWRDKGTTDLTERLQRLADKLNSISTLKKIVVETNSIGAVYIDMLKKAYSRKQIIEEFTTTNDSKREIIETVIAKIGRNEITLLPDNELDYQFSIFESTYTPSGKIAYAANPNVQDSHDDIVMATAFAVKGFSSATGQYRIKGGRHR